MGLWCNENYAGIRLERDSIFAENIFQELSVLLEKGDKVD